jgi:membrane protein YqaA with SNARE-associated domain
MILAVKRLYHWMGSQVYSPYATPILALLFYLEAIFFVPTDPMLVLFCIERRDRSLFYATVATIASVLGGLTSYALGYALWANAGSAIIHNSYVSHFISPATFAHLCQQYELYEWQAILIAGFTPIPFKAATFAAGFCRLSLVPFILCSIIARGARFYFVAIIIKIWGARMKDYIDRYFNILVLLFLLLVGISFLLLK